MKCSHVVKDIRYHTKDISLLNGWSIVSITKYIGPHSYYFICLLVQVTQFIFGYSLRYITPTLTLLF